VDESRAGRVDVDPGDIVGVSGLPMRTRRGEPSFAVDELHLPGEDPPLRSCGRASTIP
jgi:lysyl-tRNA synthetase class II